MAKKKRRGNGYWYQESSKDECAKRLVACVDAVINHDTQRFDRYEKYLKNYGGSRLIGIKPWETPTNAIVNMNDAVRDALRLNVVRSALDTITSKVGKLRPRPTFLTSGGDWAQKLKAKKLQRFMDGAYHQSDCYELAPDVFRDAMIFGTGIIHTYGKDGRIVTERVPAWELLVEQADAMYGKPRTIHRVKWVANECCDSLWGYHEERESIADGEDGVDGQDGYTRVVESWVLPLSEAEPGRHVLMVGGVIEEDDEWTSPEFPFVFVHWSKPVQGFWGDSAVQEVVGLQVEINKLIQLVQQAMQLCGAPLVFVKDGAVLKPEVGGLGNTPGQKIIVEGGVSLSEAVLVQAFQPISPQVLGHIWSLYAKAFEILGSNQLAASATAPPGLESGRALERLSEEHSERFMTVSRHFEYCVGEAQARQFIRVAKQLDKDTKGGFRVSSPGRKKDILQLKWKEVAIDEDGYVIQVFPESVMATSPAVRMDDVQKMTDNGWIDNAEARRLLAFPDLDSSTDLATADEDNLDRQLCDMLEDGKDIMPEPYQDLEKALRRAQQAILRSQADGCPEKNLNKVRLFISACEELIKRAQPPAPAPAPEPAPTPVQVVGASAPTA